MPNAFRGPQDYLDAANDPNASVSDLEMLAKSGYSFVKVAVIAHKNVTPSIISLCLPNELRVSGDQELALAIVRNQKTPADILDQLATLVIEYKFDGRILDLALEICCHPHASDQNIKSIVTSENANSDFRNQLWKKCAQNNIRSMLDDIKERNKLKENERSKKREISESSSQERFQNAVPEAGKTIDQSPSSIAQPDLDARLIGSWTFTDSSSSSYGYSAISSVSVSVHETFVFMDDGRFFRRSDVFADQSSSASQMAWSRSETGDRGRWSIRFGSLHLDWDDNYVSDAGYYIAHGALEIRWPKGPRYYLRN